MRFFTRRHATLDVERLLHEQRPEPPEALVDLIASRVTPHRSRVRSLRPALLTALTVGGLVATGAFGGVGYAATAAKAVGKAIGATTSGPGGRGTPVASNAPGNPTRTTICHATGSASNPYLEITVDNNALPAHQAHQVLQDIIPAPATGCPGGQPPGDGSGGDQYGIKTPICHRADNRQYVMIVVANASLAAHQAHGDIIPAPPAGCPAL